MSPVRPEPPGWLARTPLAWLLLVAVAYVALVVSQMNRPLVYDDVNFARAARQVAETGRPYGNQGWMSDLGDFSRREQWALWHPPLYVFLLGALAKLLGPSEAALRLPGLLGGLATVILTALLAAEVASGPPLQKRLGAAAAATLAGLSPLVVQSALILDIDLALLLPLTLLFLLLYLRLETTWRWPLLAPLFGVLLWTKMTNPLPLLASMGAWQTLRGQPGRAARHLLGIGLGGGALFLGTWWLVATAGDMPFQMPFAVNAVQWRDSGDVARRAYSSLEAFAGGLLPMTLWLGPWLVLAGLAAAAIRAGQLATAWQPRKVDLVLGLAVALVLGYVDKSAAWLPKYQVALAPLLAVVVAPLVADAICRHGWRALAVAVPAVLGAAWVSGTVMRDGWAFNRTWALVDLDARWFLIAAAVAGLVALALRVHAWPVLALAGLALGWNVGTAPLIARVPYSATYAYGTSGLEEAVAWVDARLATEDTYVAAKEVAYRAGPQRFVDQDTLITLLADGRLRPEWEGRPIRAVVAWVREPYVGGLLDRGLPPLGFRRTATFADYAIYEPAG